MAKKLTKKQIDLISQYPHEELLQIFLSVVENCEDAQQYLTTHYLTSLEEKLKNIEKEYKKQLRKKGNYDYFKSHTFFIELENSISTPLNELAIHFPEATVQLSTKIIDEFDQLAEKHDTSSGSWQDYLYGVIDAWIKALGALFKKEHRFDIATPYFAMKKRCDLFPNDLLSRNKAYIPHEALLQLRNTALENNNLNDAVTLSFILKDFDFLDATYQDNRFNQQQEYCLDYAKLLLDEFKTETSIQVLNDLIQAKPISSSIQHKANNVLIDAYYEDGNTEQALQLCKDLYRKYLDTTYCQKYLKYHPQQSNADLHDFYQIASQRGAAYHLKLAAEMQNWSAVDQFICEQLTQIRQAENKDDWFDQLPNIDSVSNIRKWSTTLAQQGFYTSAVVIRRKLLELNLSYAKSKYYKYAVSDLKKSIDYLQLVNDEGQELITTLPVYIAHLNSQHGRKYSFWQECFGVIPADILQKYI